jgi:hypothetical protein
MRRVRMPYKRFSRVAWTFSIPKFWQFFKESDFFNSHACLRQQSGWLMEFMRRDLRISENLKGAFRKVIVPTRPRSLAGSFI